jgi:murein DD-endopeptidase MepM/ murein hydrolase activator NlpD
MTLTILELNKQVLAQYGAVRRNGETPSGVVGVHTAENRPDMNGIDTGAEDVAQFILTRSDHGSYHDLVDADSILHMAPYIAEVWGAPAINNHGYHVSAAVKENEWKLIPKARRDNIVKNMAVAVADYAQWLEENFGILIPAKRITAVQARNKVPGFVSHHELDPGRRFDPGVDFDWDLFLSTFAKLRGLTVGADVKQPDIKPSPPFIDKPVEPPVVDEEKPEELETSYLPLLIDGTYGQRTVVELQRALKAEGSYQGLVDGVAGKMTYVAYQTFLKGAGAYTGLLDGDFGALSVKAEQTYLKHVRTYTGLVDGSRGPETYKGLQRALNQGLIKHGIVVPAVVPAPVKPEPTKPVEESFLPLKIDGNAGTVTYKELQKALRNSGYYTGLIDGDFGKLTKTSYQLFLKETGAYQGLIDGDFGPLAVKAEQTYFVVANTYFRVVDGVRGVETIKGLQRALNAGAIAKGKFKVNSDLPLLVDGKFGPTTVKETQRALTVSGHYDGKIDGIFLNMSVKAYQSLLAAAGTYRGIIDGNYGKVTAKAEQQFLKNTGNYSGLIDGDRGPMTVKALQTTLNLHELTVADGKGSVPSVSKPSSPSVGMISPAKGRVSSEFGWRPAFANIPAMMHAGIDIANATGTPVYAAFAGRVVRAGWAVVGGRSGNGVLIMNPDGEHQYYGHLSRIRVKVGDWVSIGQRVGDMGATGNVTGPHLHFETWKTSSSGSATNPRVYFNYHRITPGS